MSKEMTLALVAIFLVLGLFAAMSEAQTGWPYDSMSPNTRVVTEITYTTVEGKQVTSVARSVETEIEEPYDWPELWGEDDERVITTFEVID
jgi:hypothetical protein